MAKPELIDKYNVEAVRKYISTRHKDINSIGRDADGNSFVFTGRVEHSSYDYLSFIAYQSNGFTEVGGKLFQESVAESYTYSVLGSQVLMKGPIVGNGYSSGQVQDNFRVKVNTMVIQ